MHTQSGARACQQWPSDINAPTSGRKASVHRVWTQQALTATAETSPAATAIMNKVENKVFKRICPSWNEPAATSFEKWFMPEFVASNTALMMKIKNEPSHSAAAGFTLVLITYFTRVAKKKMIALLPTVFLSLDVLHCVLLKGLLLLQLDLFADIKSIFYHSRLNAKTCGLCTHCRPVFQKHWCLRLGYCSVLPQRAKIPITAVLGALLSESIWSDP